MAAATGTFGNGIRLEKRTAAGRAAHGEMRTASSA
jgi:hypothetical protein